MASDEEEEACAGHGCKESRNRVKCQIAIAHFLSASVKSAFRVEIIETFSSDSATKMTSKPNAVYDPKPTAYKAVRGVDPIRSARYHWSRKACSSALMAERFWLFTERAHSPSWLRKHTVVRREIGKE